MKLLLLACLTLISLNSCITNYGIANIGSESKYLVKPNYEDSTATASYIAGQFNHNGGKGYYDKELSYFGDIMFNRSHTSKHFIYSYAAIGYFGKYTVSEVAKYQGEKNFYGSALTGEISLNIPFKKVDWRVIGLRTTATYETGSYAKFRENAESEDLIFNVHPHNAALNIALTHDVIVKLRKISFGLYSAQGITLGKDSNGILTLSNTLHLTRRRVTGQAQMTMGILGPGTTYSLGISYKLK
jgi:hypothetical protein